MVVNSCILTLGGSFAKDMDRAVEELDALHPQRAWWEQRKKITGAAESGCNWDRDGFKKWAEWTAEPDDFHYHEARRELF